MSEFLTHTAIGEDSSRLALMSDTISDAFKVCIENHMDAIILGAATRSGDAYTIKLLDYARDRWDSRQDGDYVEETLAYLIGWRTHLAGDRTFKGVFRVVDNDHYAENRPSPSDASIYHDIVVYHEVFDSGRRQPWSPSTLDFRMETHPAFKALDVLAIEDAFVPMWRQQLLELHSYLSDDEDFGQWIANIVGGDGIRPRTERFDVDLYRYTVARQHPKMDFMRRFIAEPNFYDRSDELIRLARSLQRGERDTSIDLHNALKAAEHQSQYAQGIKLGYDYLQAASDYFEGHIDAERFQLLSNMGEHHAPRSQR